MSDHMKTISGIYNASMQAFNENFVKPITQMMAATVTPLPTPEFTESEIDGEWKIYVEGNWITFDEFIEKYKMLRNMVNIK